MYPCGVGLHVTCHLFICPICLEIRANPDCLGMRRNLNVYLDFARRTQRRNPCRHPRSSEFPRFATCVYRSFLPGSHRSGLGVRQLCFKSYILSYIISLQFSFHVISMFYAFYKHYKIFISSLVMPAYFKEVDHGTELYVPEGTITVQDSDL